MNAGNVLPVTTAAEAESKIRSKLPIILGKLTAVSRSPGPLDPSKAWRRILVVDDDCDGVASLSMLLTMVGHETSTALDGLEAVRAAQSFDPHIVLLDLELPALNGFEVCRQIRAASWGKSMLIVAVTGWSDEEHRQEALAAGFDMHLVKPVHAETLMTVLAAAS